MQNRYALSGSEAAMGVTSYLFALICHVHTCCHTGGSRYSLFGVEVLSVCRRLEMYYVYAKINWCFVIMSIYWYGYKADNARGTYAHCLTLANA